MKRSGSAWDDRPELPYLVMRRGIGLLSLALPIVLVLGKLWLDGGGIQGSISAYYYTVMGDYFVGTQCAIAILLACYRYERIDTYLGSAVALFAVGIALLPTTQPGVSHSRAQTIVGQVHFTCATLFFLGMAYFSFFLFTRSDPQEAPSAQSRRRNVIYRACGITIVACLALILVTNLAFSETLRDKLHPLFWLETIAVWAIALSWLTKGGLVMAGSEAPADQLDSKQRSQHGEADDPPHR
jgi:hypothetical protein